MADEFEMTARPAMAGHDESARAINAAEAAAMARAQIAARGFERRAEDAALPEPRNPNLDPRISNPEQGWPITRPNIPGAEPGESPLMTVFRQARTEIGGWGTKAFRAGIEETQPTRAGHDAPEQGALALLTGPRRFGPNIGEHSPLQQDNTDEPGAQPDDRNLPAPAWPNQDPPAPPSEHPPEQRESICVCADFTFSQSSGLGNWVRADGCKIVVDPRNVKASIEKAYCTARLYHKAIPSWPAPRCTWAIRAENRDGAESDLIKLDNVISAEHFDSGSESWAYGTDVCENVIILDVFAKTDDKGKPRLGTCWLAGYINGHLCGRLPVLVTDNPDACFLELQSIKAKQKQADAPITVTASTTVTTARIASFAKYVQDIHEQRSAADRPPATANCIIPGQRQPLHSAIVADISVISRLDHTFEKPDCCCIYLASMTVNVAYRVILDDDWAKGAQAGEVAAAEAELKQRAVQMADRLNKAAWKSYISKTILSYVSKQLPECLKTSEAECATRVKSFDKGLVDIDIRTSAELAVFWAAYGKSSSQAASLLSGTGHTQVYIDPWQAREIRLIPSGIDSLKDDPAGIDNITHYEISASQTNRRLNDALLIGKVNKQQHDLLRFTDPLVVEEAAYYSMEQISAQNDFVTETRRMTEALGDQLDQEGESASKDLYDRYNAYVAMTNAAVAELWRMESHNLWTYAWRLKICAHSVAPLDRIVTIHTHGSFDELNKYAVLVLLAKHGYKYPYHLSDAEKKAKSAESPGRYFDLTDAIVGVGRISCRLYALRFRACRSGADATGINGIKEIASQLLKKEGMSLTKPPMFYAAPGWIQNPSVYHWVGGKPQLPAIGVTALPVPFEPYRYGVEDMPETAGFLQIM